MIQEVQFESGGMSGAAIERHVRKARSINSSGDQLRRSGRMQLVRSLRGGSKVNGVWCGAAEQRISGEVEISRKAG